MITNNGGAKIPVAHVGTGETGTEALKGIIHHPDLELVSLWVTSPEKVGRDAGELVGMDPVGVAAVDSLDAALDAEPTVLSYCGNGLGREQDAVKDMAKALRRGVNVATISLLGMMYPTAGRPSYVTRWKMPRSPAKVASFQQVWTPGSPATSCRSLC